MKNRPAPFSVNQVAFLHRSMVSWFNVAEGGKRGGKNVLNTMAFCIQLEEHPDKLHLCAGVSVAAAKLNILVCDGFGLLNYFHGRCREGKYKDRDCLYIRTRTGLKVVLISGGAKDGDEKLIKGNTYGMAYITEANECHPKFIQEAFDRTLTSNSRKVFHDLNPKFPTHWYYTSVLAHHEAMQEHDLSYGYNYGHFTIADNMSVSDEKLKRALKTYEKESVWYKRDIRGERCIAEGLIYRSFAEHKDDFLVKIGPNRRLIVVKTGAELPRITQTIVGGDWGGNKSAHSFTATGFSDDRDLMVALRAERHPAKDTDAMQVSRLFNAFVTSVESKYYTVDDGYGDSEGQTIKNTVSNNGPIRLRNSIKNPINERIDAATLMIARRRFFYTEDCEPLVKALCEAVWNPKAPDKRLDDGTTWIDPLDSWEYSWERYIKRYTQL